MSSSLCVACKNINTTTNIDLFSFPRDAFRRNEWLIAIGRSDLLLKLMNDDVRNKHKICEKHFEQRFFALQSTSRRILKGNAFPTLNLEYVPVICNIPSVTEQNKQLEEALFAARTCIVTKTDFQKLSQKFLTNGMAQLVKWHMDSRSKQTEKKQYGQQFMLFSLMLYRTNPYVYKFIKSTLSLPPPIELKRFVLPHGTEIDQRLINVLISKVNEMTPREKICSICVDYSLVKPGLFYDISNDRMIGFHDINGNQKPNPARYVLIVMARGIIDDWQLLIAHCFLPDYRNRVEYVSWIEEILYISIGIGLDVRTFVTNPDLHFVSSRAADNRGVSVVSDRDIYRLIDAHCLIEKLKAFIPCLVLGENNKPLSDFEEKLDYLAKILYCNKSQGLALNASLSEGIQQLQFDFLKQNSKLFERLRMFMPSGINVTPTELLTTLQMTITSVLRLHDSLKNEGLNLTLTSHLSLDVIRDFFVKVKNKFKCQEPTCRQVNMILRKTYARTLTSRSIVADDDMESLLQKVGEYPNLDELTALARNTTSLAVGKTDYNFELPKKQVISYASKYLFSKCINRHIDCLELARFLKQKKIRNYQIWSKNIPPKEFIEFVFLLEKQIQDFFDGGNFKNVANEIFNSIRNTLIVPNSAFPCKCFPIDYAIKLYIRFRLYHTVKMNNKIINVPNNLSFTVCNFNVM